MEQKKFSVMGVPELLVLRPEIAAAPITLAQVNTIMEHNNRVILPVSGDCMEAAGLVHGGWAAVDFTRFPAPPRCKSRDGDGGEDLCLCCAVSPGRPAPAVMCKAYLGVLGPRKIVGTHYDLTKGKRQMNCAMEALRILGVIYASWDAEGRLLWQRDPRSFPDRLETAPTIRGGNVGDPITLAL